MPNHRRFGFELEMTPYPEAIANQLREAVNENSQFAFSYMTESPETWTLKHEHTGCEFTSPALRSSPSGFIETGKVIRSIKTKLGGRDLIKRYCGFHVHVEINDFDQRQLRNMIRLFKHLEPALLQIQPDSRSVGNNWVVKLNSNTSVISDSTDVTQIFYSHTSAVNFYRYGNRGTCEIRYGAGSVRRQKVTGWIQLLIWIIETSKRIESELDVNSLHITRDYQGLIQFIETSEPGTWIVRRRPKLISFINKRYSQLRCQEETTENVRPSQ
jgi:hypothetical protein